MCAGPHTAKQQQKWVHSRKTNEWEWENNHECKMYISYLKWWFSNGMLVSRRVITKFSIWALHHHPVLWVEKTPNHSPEGQGTERQWLNASDPIQNRTTWILLGCAVSTTASEVVSCLVVGQRGKKHDSFPFSLSISADSKKKDTKVSLFPTHWKGRDAKTNNMKWTHKKSLKRLLWKPSETLKKIVDGAQGWFHSQRLRFADQILGLSAVIKGRSSSPNKPGQRVTPCRRSTTHSL